MELRNTVTDGLVSCSDELGKQLIESGSYEEVGAPKKAPAKKAAPRRTHKAETE